MEHGLENMVLTDDEHDDIVTNDVPHSNRGIEKSEVPVEDGVYSPPIVTKEFCGSLLWSCNHSSTSSPQIRFDMLIIATCRSREKSRKLRDPYGP